jgi:hypothetical protein
MACGVTIVDPSRSGTLPDDADDLLERADYWVSVKNVCATTLPPGAELALMIDKQG